jgi:hypothetical protein
MIDVANPSSLSDGLARRVGTSSIVERSRSEAVEVVGVDGDVPPRVELVAELDLVVVDLASALLGHLLVPDPCARALLQLVEVDAVVVDGRVGLHGDVDEPERDRT